MNLIISTSLALDVDLKRALEKFTQLGRDTYKLPDFDAKAYHEILLPIISSYRQGQIDTVTLFEHIRTALPFKPSDDEIKQAWLAHIQVTREKFAPLLDLAKRHSITLISNTNSLDTDYILSRLRELYGVSFVHQHNQVYVIGGMNAYFSHMFGQFKDSLLGMILDKENLAAEETVLVDPDSQNCQAASELNMQTLQWKTDLTTLEANLPTPRMRMGYGH